MHVGRCVHRAICIHLVRYRDTYVRRSMCPSCDMHTFSTMMKSSGGGVYAAFGGSSCGYRAMRYFASVGITSSRQRAVGCVPSIPWQRTCA